MILAGDIGGTHTRVGIFSGDPALPRLDRFAEYNSRDYPSMEHIVQEFLGSGPTPQCFCFGVAGPVVDGVARPTNLPWELNTPLLSASLGAPVTLINDLEANAYGVATLGPEDLTTLQEGSRGEHGNAAVISAGTGLGEAGLFWDNGSHRPFASEGGHSTFSPRNSEEIALLEYLLKKYAHVSWERVLSGPGLFNIYQFLRDAGHGAEPDWLAAQLLGVDPGAVISDAALHGRSGLCAQALDLFVRLYGSEAGNLALKTLAVAGVYIGGGIAPRIAGKLKDGPFLQAFLSMGRMQPLLERMPVHIITNNRAALQGAARRGMLSLNIER